MGVGGFSSGPLVLKHPHIVSLGWCSYFIICNVSVLPKAAMNVAYRELLTVVLEYLVHAHFWEVSVVCTIICNIP